MFHFLFSFIIFGYVVSSPTPKSVEDVRIVGGEDIDISLVPYQVSILQHGKHICGGAIISNDLILTAAHCIVGTKPDSYQIRVGSSSSAKGGTLYPVGDLIWHPKFTYQQMDSDVALLWLAKPLVFDENVAPIKLVDYSDEIKDGEITIVTGWGHMKEGGGYPMTLQMVLVPKVNAYICNRAYSPQYKITQNMFCAGVPAGGKDACQGDSGGPLVYKGKLAGIVSWGLGCARPRYPGVYAKISALRKWIDDNVAYLRMKHIFRMFVE